MLQQELQPVETKTVVVPRDASWRIRLRHCA
jgi:hypothetical protein